MSQNKLLKSAQKQHASIPSASPFLDADGQPTEQLGTFLEDPGAALHWLFAQLFTIANTGNNDALKFLITKFLAEDLRIPDLSTPKEILALAERRTSLQYQTANLQKELDSLQQQRDTCQRETEIQRDKLIAEKDHLAQNKAKGRNIIDSLNAQIDDLVAKRDALQGDIAQSASVTSPLDDALTTENTRLKEEVERLNAQLENASRDPYAAPPPPGDADEERKQRWTQEVQDYFAGKIRERDISPDNPRIMTRANTFGRNQP